VTTIGRGLYETLVTEALENELHRLPAHLHRERRDLELGEAADRLALHVGRVLRRALEDVADGSRAEVGVRLARRLLLEIGSALDADSSPDLPVEPGSLLTAIFALRPDGSPEPITAPLIPLLDTTLLTNAPDEPRVGRQIAAELDSADRIDVVMAFIRRSGLRPLLDALRRATTNGRPLRVLTTIYTGSTEADALDELQALGADVRVSYDRSSTRLHAKAWLFHRDSGFSTAYIGSSNLTHSAHVTGLEWNVRVSAARNPDVIQKVAAVFDSYWESSEFRPYDRPTFEMHVAAPERTLVQISPIELRPEPFQERLLEQIALARSQGHHRNLLVAATGTGKTVMAAVDYARLLRELPRARLLFVAHRREILDQSRATFRHALRDHSFGELWVARRRPVRFEHVFASIQSLHRADLEHLPPDHFDVVIVDEFHHAAADSYARLLAHVRPRELLGLTATPERSDGLSILEHFDERIAAELRLWDAIDQHRLVPFLYYGLHDGLDLTQVPWRRGRGYDVDALSGLLTGNEPWARLVLEQLARHVDDVDRVRCLGFCVSIDHARFMERVFRNLGVRATAVWGDSSEEDRERALRELAQGTIQVLFSVDLFNEGVDLPTVDTLLLLRPTDSPTLFLQQLGRGLRKSPGKLACTVLDFVGQHRREFRMDRRFRALLGGSRDDLSRQIAGGFPFLPAGCHMELDPVATDIVLSNIKAAIPASWQKKAEELAQIAASCGEVSLATFLATSGLEVEDVYSHGRGWSDLREEARLPIEPPGPQERGLRRACGRLLHVDDPRRVEGYRQFLQSKQPHPVRSLSLVERRLLRMLVASMVDQVAGREDDLDAGAQLLWAHPQVRAELLELLDVLETRVTHLTLPLTKPEDVPLRVHGRYTRLEILGALGVHGDRATVPSWQSGVQWVAEAQSDVFAFTLDKTNGSFSPTTRYRDYAINRELIHWESQSVTRADSDTGRRYQEHSSRGTHVLLFARHRQSDRAFHFLGPARYVFHRSERPMAVTWRLMHPLPGDLLASFAAAVA
jgi:superfamily II DNA or RNA helicase/HKD family nuclease